jgi:ketosteroid isomerase-like protein
MSVETVAKEFYAHCQAGKYDEAEKLWSEDVVSLEASEGPMRETRGRAAAHAKGEWWYQNNEIHSAAVSGPYIHGDQFALRFEIDFTSKADGERKKMDEVALYSVKNGKIVEERFFS